MIVHKLIEKILPTQQIVICGADFYYFLTTPAEMLNDYPDFLDREVEVINWSILFNAIMISVI